MPRGRPAWAAPTSSLAFASMACHCASSNQSNPAGGEPQTKTKLSANCLKGRSRRMRSSSANLAASSGCVTNALCPPPKRKITPSNGRFSIAVSSSRICCGVGTSQPYSMSFLSGAGWSAAMDDADAPKAIPSSSARAHPFRAAARLTEDDWRPVFETEEGDGNRGGVCCMAVHWSERSTRQCKC